MAAVELHKLNGDTSWLIRIPKSGEDEDDVGKTSFYNLVLDPWLHPTPQVDGPPVFSRQTRVEPAAFSSLAQLDQWLRSQSHNGQLDAILFSHPFTDHVHPETITHEESLAVLQRLIVFTTNDSLPALRSLQISLDASKIIRLSPAAFEQSTIQRRMLPPGIEIQHLSARDWALSPVWAKLHGGILISCFNCTNHVRVLYSPHGITPTSLPRFDRQTLPLIGTVACGFPNVLDLIPTFEPDMVLATHDEHKRAEGIVGRLLSRQSFPLNNAQQLVKARHPQASYVLNRLGPGESITIA